MGKMKKPKDEKVKKAKKLAVKKDKIMKKAVKLTHKAEKLSKKEERILLKKAKLAKKAEKLTLKNDKLNEKATNGTEAATAETVPSMDTSSPAEPAVDTSSMLLNLTSSIATDGSSSPKSKKKKDKLEKIKKKEKQIKKKALKKQKKSLGADADLMQKAMERAGQPDVIVDEEGGHEVTGLDREALFERLELTWTAHCELAEDNSAELNAAFKPKWTTNQKIMDLISAVPSDARSEASDKLPDGVVSFIDERHNKPAKGGACGQPVVIIVCMSAIRCTVFNKKYKQGNFKCAKLFSKHMKVQDQQKYLASHPVDVAVGTPGRLQRLIQSGHLKSTRLQAIVIDLSFVSAKQRCIVDDPNSKPELIQLLTHICSTSKDNKLKYLLL